MATTADALLAAVRADPDADLPRLVYADHLDDTGDVDRAEFIRVQCELARLAEWDDRRPALEDREHELLDRYEGEWLGVMDRLDEWEWRRGFVDEVSSDWWSLRQSGADEFDGHPIRAVNCSHFQSYHTGPQSHGGESWLSGVRRLSLAEAPISTADLQALVRSPYLSRLTALDVSGNPMIRSLPEVMIGAAFADGLRELTAGGHSGPPPDTDLLARVLADAPLDHLHLPNYGLDAGRLAELLAAPFGDRMISLDVADNDLPTGAAWSFRWLSGLSALRAVDVSGTELGRSRLADLLRLPGLRGVTDLQANRCEGDHRWYQELADTPFWPQATSLRVHSAHAMRDDFIALCRASGSPTLRLLDLADNHLGLECVRALADAVWGDSVTWMALSRNTVGPPAAAALAASGKFTRLRTLHLAFDPHTDDTATALASAPSLARLRLLTLSSTRITDRSVPVLLEAPHWRLSGLGLSTCNLSVTSVYALATSPRLHRLQWLDLSGNPRLGGDVLMPLAESPHLSRLCELDIGGVGASDRVRDALRQRLGRRLSD